MSAVLENVPRGESDVAEVTSLAGAVREWQQFDLIRGCAAPGRQFQCPIPPSDGAAPVVYMHGILERTRVPEGDRERFVYFFADGPCGEEKAFAEAFAFLWEDPQARIYYYSKFERSAYRVLQQRYPSVCTADQIERLYDPARAIDLLFDVVAPATEWPTSDISIKTLAKRLGFKWSDIDPSGASSVAWFGQWTATGDPAIRDRIIVYNRDDCVATRVVLDGLIDLPVRDGPDWPQSPDGRHDAGGPEIGSRPSIGSASLTSRAGDRIASSGPSTPTPLF